MKVFPAVMCGRNEEGGVMKILLEIVGNICEIIAAVIAKHTK